MKRDRLPDCRLHDHLREPTVHLHAGHDHDRALVHHHLRHPPEQEAAPVHQRQDHDRRMDRRSPTGRSAALRSLQFLKNQVVLVSSSRHK